MQLGDKQVYTVRDVSVLTGFSRQTVTRMFEREKGVLVVGHLETLRKRRYRSIRIPRPVFERVIQRLTVR